MARCTANMQAAGAIAFVLPVEAIDGDHPGPWRKEAVLEITHEAYVARSGEKTAKITSARVFCESQNFRFRVVRTIPSDVISVGSL